EQGLEPLALDILKWPAQSLEELATPYTNEEVIDVSFALQGASDIIAELIADDPELRKKLREYYQKYGVLTTTLKKGAEDTKKIFEMYYDYTEPVAKIVPHRTLAINRGENEDILRVNLQVEEDRVVSLI
ncbi:RNA-binding transcriptional accessory protein, partial [Acinetobacter baumannii]